MIGHSNSKAEESKIQIDTGLFVLYSFSYCVCVTFFSVARAVALYEPLSPSQWTCWNSLSDRQHPGLINIAQVNEFFLTHFKLIAREATPQQTLFYSNPVEVIFVSFSVKTPMMFLASPHRLSTGGIATVTLSPTSGCSSHRLLFSVFSAWFSRQVLVRFRMSKIFLTRFSVGVFFFFCLPDVRFHHLSWVLEDCHSHFPQAEGSRFDQLLISSSLVDKLTIILHCH